MANDRVEAYWRIDQRPNLAEFFRTPGDSERDSDSSAMEPRFEEDFTEPTAFETCNHTGLCSLPNHALMRLFMFLGIPCVLTITSVCRYLNSVRFTKEYLAVIGVPYSLPLSNDNRSFSRGYLIEAIRKRILSKLYEKSFQQSLVVSNRVPTLFSIQRAAGITVFFSEIEGRLLIWSVFRDRQTLHYNIECSAKVIAISVEPGKIALLSATTVELKRFPWENLRSVDVATVSYRHCDYISAGSIFIFSRFAVVAAILNYRLMVFSENMTVLLEFRGINWPFSDIQCSQVNPALPYLAIAAKNSIQIFDVTKNRKTPVFTYSTPLLCDFKFAFLYVTDDVLSRCFMILHNGQQSTTGVVIVNNSVLCKAAGDIAVVKQHLLVFDQISMSLKHFLFTLRGHNPVRIFYIQEKIVDVKLSCIEERCLIIGRKEHTQNNFFMRLFDYKGWKFFRVPITDLHPERVYMCVDTIVIVGQCMANNTKVLLKFDYYDIGTTVMSIKARVDKAILDQTVSKKDIEKEKSIKEEEIKKRREARKKEINEKKERKKQRNSVYWKPSRRSLPNQHLDLQEDFCLMEPY